MSQYRLTKQQEELWYTYKMKPNSGSYNIAFLYRIKGPLNERKTEEIYRCIGGYFEAFRTNFSEQDSMIIQKVETNFSGDFVYIEAHNTPEKEIFTTLDDLRKKPFNLEKDCLFRANLIKSQDNCYFLQFVWHHIIADGLTINRVSEFFECLYNGNIKSINKFTNYSLADYLYYEKKTISEYKAKTVFYWQKYLQGCKQNNIVDYGYKKQRKNKCKPIDINHHLLAKFTKKHQVTPFIFFNALISVFVFRCFHLHDIIISYPKNIRPNKFNKIIGHFVSIFPIRAYPINPWLPREVCF